MSQDIGELNGLITKGSEVQRRILQAVDDTQSEHTALLRDIRRTVDRMASKVDAIETQVAGTSTRIGLLEGHMGAFGTRMDRLETRADQLDGKVAQLDDKVERVDGKVDALAEEMNGKFATIIGMLDSRK